jgi:hypothetical protein
MVTELAEELPSLANPEEWMQLTLTYSGTLHAQSSNDTRNTEKHEIRSQFHEQLKELWSTHPALEGTLDKWLKAPPKEQTITNPNQFVTPYDLNGFCFCRSSPKNGG